MRLGRRGFIQRLAAAGAGVAMGGPPGLRNAGGDAAVTPAAAFDPEIETFMKARNVPGGALAVAWHGRIRYVRGYGWADRERKIPVRPDALFRIASISKPITAVAVLQLVEQGRLDLD